MKNLHFTQEQVTKILEETAYKENGMQELQKISLEAMMRAERENSIHQKGIWVMDIGHASHSAMGRYLSCKYHEAGTDSFIRYY